MSIALNFLSSDRRTAQFLTKLSLDLNRLSYETKNCFSFFWSFISESLPTRPLQDFPSSSRVRSFLSGFEIAKLGKKLTIKL